VGAATREDRGCGGASMAGGMEKEESKANSHVPLRSPGRAYTARAMAGGHEAHWRARGGR
jgi:hypothetical protein